MAQGNKLFIGVPLIMDVPAERGLNYDFFTLFPQIGSDVTFPLSARDDLIPHLFMLMGEKSCFLKAATVLEDILQVKKEMVKLESIRKFRTAQGNLLKKIVMLDSTRQERNGPFRINT